MAQPFVPVDITTTFEANLAAATQSRYPTGIGANDTWTLGAGTDKVDAVDADDADDTTYVYRSDSAGIQMYTYSAFGTHASATFSLDVYVTAREAAGDATIQAVIRVNGTNYFATAVAMTGSYVAYQFTWSQNPDTVADWTSDDLNGTGANPLQQIGFRCLSMEGGDTVRVTQLRADVTQSGWTDLSPDVAVSPAPTWDWGFPGSAPTDLVAVPGRLRLSLRNDDSNRAGLEGYYSPGHSNARTGWGLGVPLRVKVVASGSTSYKKYYIRSLRPDAGPAGPRRVAVLGTDWMDEAARQVLTGVSVQVDASSNALMTTITNAVAQAPDNTSFDAGSYAYPFALDEIDTHRDVALKAYQLLAQSGWDRIYLTRDGTDGETLRFEDHSHRLTTVTNDATFDGDTSELRAVHDESRIINIADCSTPVRTRDDAGATTVLASLGNDRPVVGVSETVTIFLSYRDPDNNAERVAGTDMIAPVEGTDYVMVSAGADVSSDHTVTATFTTTDVEIDITNNGSVVSTIILLQVRGRGLYNFGEKVSRSEDATSKTTYGERAVKFRIPWQTDHNVCQGMTDWLVDVYKDPQTDADEMMFVANRHDTLAQASHDVDVGSRIALDESVTGISASGGSGYWVDHVTMSLHQTMLRVVYRLQFAREDQNYFVLDSSALDGSDVLAYF